MFWRWCFVRFIREKLRELNNELLKKNSFIDEMEPKYNASCEFGPPLNSECVKCGCACRPPPSLASVLIIFKFEKNLYVVPSQPNEWRSWKRLWRRKMKTWNRWRRDIRNTWKKPRAWVDFHYWPQVNYLLHGGRYPAMHAVGVGKCTWCDWMCRLQVIRTLDPKQNQGSGPEVQALKNQLQEKERMLHSLEVIKS